MATAAALRPLPTDLPSLAFHSRSLYRSLHRTAKNFALYNFREYAKRRTRDKCRENAHVTDVGKIQELIREGERNLQILKRQSIISGFFQMDRLVVEGGQEMKETGKVQGMTREKETGWT